MKLLDVVRLKDDTLRETGQGTIVDVFVAADGVRHFTVEYCDEAGRAEDMPTLPEECWELVWSCPGPTGLG
jgi:hypothetical protein